MHGLMEGGAADATSWGIRRAEHVINSAEEDIGKRVREITGGKGVDAAVDPIGGETSGKVLSTLKRGGVLRVYGTLSGTMQLPFGDACGCVGDSMLALQGLLLSVCCRHFRCCCAPVTHCRCLSS